ncbi:MAG: hypothetical protein A3E01_03000 [Gammaproteobacteria bacterium RIFCSPHIGHO2_12_FULL_63_22]|nr:MAG: hypothetical protein A3E01_03000 [Gammaproteobacteria bacterium RIFCSPHIGHO2_12_FULL_63_22]
MSDDTIGSNSQAEMRAIIARLEDIERRKKAAAEDRKVIMADAKAKGGKPVKRNIRDLAWVVVMWAQRARQGINCAAFRNEGAGRSSDLIRAADRLAFARWPGERHYTYVNAAKVRSSNPGFCFLMAGWRRCGRTRGGLHILELRPEWVAA